ncbi:MAG: hypothetical protein HKN23_06885 [Verrucomicrobiales bacterium]|nr:hypothetical protein [Verrucomicrobiales bacterium]
MAFFSATAGLTAGEPENVHVLPTPPSLEHFQALFEKSPFTRTLNLSDTLVLTGVAQLDGKPVATLIDTEDGQSIAISETPNERGWKMVEFTGLNDLEVAVAAIAFESGEVVRIRYDRERIKSTAQRLKFKSQARAQQAAAKARAQSSGGGPAHGVPQERVAMLKKIDTRELPKGYNPGAGRNAEESHKLHQSYVDRRMGGMSPQQKGAVGQLWQQKVAVDPNMKNRGASFVRIMEHVAEHVPK